MTGPTGKQRIETLLSNIAVLKGQAMKQEVSSWQMLNLIEETVKLVRMAYDADIAAADRLDRLVFGPRSNPKPPEDV